MARRAARQRGEASSSGEEAPAPPVPLPGGSGGQALVSRIPYELVCKNSSHSVCQLKAMSLCTAQ
jgi:hypothetical protein